MTYTEWRDLKDELNATPSDQRLDTDERNERVLYGMMIFLFVFTGLLWLITLALRNRIRLSVVILEQASKAVARMPWVSRPLSHLSHTHAFVRIKAHTKARTHALTHSFTHSFTHSLLHSFTHSLTHSLTHSSTP